MKRKFVILILMVLLIFTACGKKKLTKEELEHINFCIEVSNEEADGMNIAKLDEKNRTVNFIIASDVVISNSEGLKESYTKISKVFFEDIEDLKVQWYYEDDEKNPLLILEDGKVVEDNFEKYLKENPDKVDNSIVYDSVLCRVIFYEFDFIEEGNEKIVVITVNITNNEPVSRMAARLMEGSILISQGGERLDGPGYLPSSNEYKPMLKDATETVEMGEEIDTVVIYQLKNMEEPITIESFDNDFYEEIEIK
ncbi:DUF5067 domain-containing protein [Peptostreptococcaceae bacterium OttesenSCG-928-C18]|nr:DUF5067 domain-containing protein [Peptostreptococcaceae bacterium OttesenSCG-928-C18]